MRTLALASLLLAGGSTAAAAVNPPVSLKLSDDMYAPGDRAKVHVKATEDGSLVVLQMDPEHHIRVLYPLSPDGKSTVRGGHQIEVRGRGDRDAFTVTEHQGSGMVLAARSDQPFNFEAIAKGDRWDPASLTVPNDSALTPEESLLEVVDRMTNGHYDYDAAAYGVGHRPIYRPYSAWGFGPWYPGYYYDPLPYAGFGLGLRFGGFHHW